MKEKIVFCWSGGKDSALALHRLRAEGRYEVVSLLTMCNDLSTFAFAGPIFQQPVRFTIGETVYRPVEVTHPGATTTPCPTPGARQTKGFWFCDLLAEP